MEEIRIHKYIADAGIMSRRQAEEAIKRGEIKVNGERAEIGMKIDPLTDTLEYYAGLNEASVYLIKNPEKIITYSTKSELVKLSQNYLRSSEFSYEPFNYINNKTRIICICKKCNKKW